MKRTVNKIDFVRGFEDFNREDSFSVEAREAIFDYIEEVNPDWEYDPIAVCVEWTEYENLDELNEAYGTEYESWNEVADETTVLELSGEKAVIMDF